MSEETKKEFLTKEQLNQLETVVNTFIDGFNEIVKKNTTTTPTTEGKTQTKILGCNEQGFKNWFKFTKDDYKFSIENFKEELEKNNKNEQEVNKQTLSDFVINKLCYGDIFVYNFFNYNLINYINNKDNSQAKQDIFNLFNTLIDNLINNGIISKDFFKSNSNMKIGRLLSIIAMHSPDSNKFTELTNKLLTHIDEKDKKNIFLYDKLNGDIDIDKQNTVYYLLQNPNINIADIETIIQTADKDNKIEYSINSKNVLNLLKKDYIIDDQNKSKELIDLFFTLLEKTLEGNKDELEEYFSNSISSYGTYSNFLLDYAITYNRINTVEQKSKFKTHFYIIIDKLKQEFGEDFVVNLLSIAKIKTDENEEKTKFDFLNTNLIQDETIRDKVISKINQKKETIKINKDGKIEKFEELNKLTKNKSEEFKKQFLELGGYDKKMAYLYYVSNLCELYDAIEIGYSDSDVKNNKNTYKNTIKLISECDPEFTVNFISNIYKNTDSNKSLNDTSLVSGLITNTEIDIPNVLLNYNEKVRKNEIKDINHHKTKTLVSKYNIIENTSYGKQVYRRNENTSDTVIGTLKLINDLCDYEELKHAIIHNRTSTGSMEIFTIAYNKQECNYNTFKQVIDLITESAKKAGKNPNEELVNEILPHFGGEHLSFRHKIFEIASTEDIIKYLNKVKEICNNYDKEKKQKEGVSLENLLLNNYGDNIFDLMNNGKENKLTQEHYKQIKEILGEELYIELASRSNNEDAKNILTQEQKQNIGQQKNTRDDLIKKMVKMVQKQDVKGIKTELNKIENEDKRCELLCNVFELSEKHIIEPKHNELGTKTLYLNLEGLEDFNKKSEKEKNKYNSNYDSVIDYENVIYITSNLIDDENYKKLAGKICRSKFGYMSYNLIADALTMRGDIINNKKIYYKNILNIISKLEKEDLIYILNLRYYNGNSENLLCSLVNTKANYEEQFGIDYTTSIISIIYEKIGYKEFQKIMGNKAVANDFNYKVKHSNTFNSEDKNNQDKTNAVKSFMSSIQEGKKPIDETLKQIQSTTNTFIKNNMNEQFYKKYTNMLSKSTEPEQPQLQNPQPSEQPKPDTILPPIQQAKKEPTNSKQTQTSSREIPLTAEQSKPTEQTKPSQSQSTLQPNSQPSEQTTASQTPTKQTTSVIPSSVQKTISEQKSTKPTETTATQQTGQQPKSTKIKTIEQSTNTIETDESIQQPSSIIANNNKEKSKKHSSVTKSNNNQNNSEQLYMMMFMLIIMGRNTKSIQQYNMLKIMMLLMMMRSNQEMSNNINGASNDLTSRVNGVMM